MQRWLSFANFCYFGPATGLHISGKEAIYLCFVAISQSKTSVDFQIMLPCFISNGAPCIHIKLGFDMVASISLH